MEITTINAEALAKAFLAGAKNLEAKKEYVKQQNPVGTQDNPIEYYDGVPLIDNAYYIKDGKRQVYMDGTWTEF